MKQSLHLLLVLTLVLLAAPASAQKRLVLVEEFTNTGCGPCATWSPVLDSCIHYRLGDCIAIKYHVGFPLATDEFYLAERDVQQARTNYYGVGGVPDTYINGMSLGSRSFERLSQAIDYCRSLPEEYTINVTRQLEGNKLSAHVSLLPNGDAASTDGLRLYVVAIEEHIGRQTPWPNGETEMNYVLRKLWSFTPEAFPFGEDVSWDIDIDADLGQLGVVAFVQNVSTREVLATAYAAPDPKGATSLELLSLSGTPDRICVPQFFGEVIFRNDGAETVTSAMLNVSVNGTLAQFPWTGSLGTLERDTMTFSGPTDFPLTESGNHAEVWLSDINGTTSASNARTTTFSNSIQASNAVQMKLYTDKKPEETTWRLYNSSGEVVREGGPYDGQARKFITVDFELQESDCYLLELLDAGGDGIKGSYGNGYYQLFSVSAEGKSTRIAQGDYDGASHHIYFRLTDTPTGIGMFNVQWPMSNGAPAYDLSGRPATADTRLRIYRDKKVLK